MIEFCKLRQKPQPTPDRFNEKMLKLGYTQYSTRINKESVRCWHDVAFRVNDDDQTTLNNDNTSNTTESYMGQA